MSGYPLALTRVSIQLKVALRYTSAVRSREAAGFPAPAQQGLSTFEQRVYAFLEEVIALAKGDT